jgi:hypothetical protein
MGDPMPGLDPSATCSLGNLMSGIDTPGADTSAAWRLGLSKTRLAMTARTPRDIGKNPSAT